MRALAFVMVLPVVVLGVTRANAVPCRVHEPVAEVLTPSGATIDSSGGIVAANPSASWELRDATETSVKLEPRTIAPGLAVIAIGASGSFELRDAKHALLAKVTAGKSATKRLPAPKPSKLNFGSPQSRGGDFTLTATFTAKPPVGAVALIVYAKGKARSWGRVRGGSAIVVYEGICQVTPPVGTVRSNLGETVTLAWLDDTGHLSAPSAALKIR